MQVSNPVHSNTFFPKHIMKQTNIDKFSTKGSTHKINQDYAYVESLEDAKLLVVSDGCSSGRLVSIGSRMMCMLATTYLKTAQYIDEFIRFPRTFEMALTDGLTELLDNEALGLQKEDLLATILAIYYDNKTSSYALKYIGDGYILIEYTSGAVILEELTYDENKPMYPIYLTSKYELSSPCTLNQKWYMKENGIWITLGTGTGYKRAIDTIFSTSESVKRMHLITDGMSSFVNKATLEKIDVTKIADEILALKSDDGPFMQRRMKRMLTLFEKKNIFPEDDFTIVSHNIKEIKSDA